MRAFARRPDVAAEPAARERTPVSSRDRDGDGSRIEKAKGDSFVRPPISRVPPAHELGRDRYAARQENGLKNAECLGKWSGDA